MTQTPPPAPARILHGILCIVIGMAFFASHDAMMKALLNTSSVWLLLFARSVIAIVILVPLMLWMGGSHRILTPLWRIHLLRGTLFAVGFSLFFIAFPFMGFAEVTTIFFSAPLITALLAALVLKEQIGRHRIAALAMGFTGLLVAMNPGGDTFDWIAILPLICAVNYALGQILIRRVGERESSLTVGLHTLGFGGLLVLPLGFVVSSFVQFSPEFGHLNLTWPQLSQGSTMLVLTMGALGTVAYILNSRAYQVAPASLIAPFDYCYLPIAAVLGYLFFDEVPPLQTIIGMALIITGGIYIGYREMRAAQG